MIQKPSKTLCKVRVERCCSKHTKNILLQQRFGTQFGAVASGASLVVVVVAVAEVVVAVAMPW